MPFINVKLIDGVFSPAQKKQIAEKLTDTMVSIEGEAMRSVTWVVVEEVKSGDWAIGGRTLTTADVHALAGQKGGLNATRQPSLEPREGVDPSRGTSAS